jgi:hypothetical protein
MIEGNCFDFNSKYHDFNLLFLPQLPRASIAFLATSFWITRGNVYSVFVSRLNPAFALSLGIGVISFILLQLVVGKVILEKKYPLWLSSHGWIPCLHRRLQRCQVLEDLCMITGTVSLNLQLLARVIQGRCPPG